MTIIKNAEVLDPVYIPSELPFREREIQRLEELVVKPLRDGISTTLFIYGSPGVGKTTTSKFTLLNRTEFRSFYFNALSHPTTRSILADVMLKLRNSGVARPSTTEIFRQISNWQKQKGMNILLIIDEVSNLLRNDLAGLQMLLRSSEAYNLTLSTVLISVDDPGTFLRGSRKISPLPISTLRFSRYSFSELYGIIMRRARDALYDGTYSPEILRMIAKVSSQYGSARLAIELLQKSSYIADYVSSNIIGSDDVRAANALINPYITESKLVQLSEEELIVLLATCRCLYRFTKTDIPCIVMNTEILMESRLRRSPTMSMIYRIVRKLEDLGMIESVIEGHGSRRGVSKSIMINDTPVRVLEKKVEEVLDRMS